MQHAVPSIDDDVVRARARIERIDRWSGSWRIALLGALAFGYTALGLVGALLSIPGDVGCFAMLVGVVAAVAAVGWSVRVSHLRPLDDLEAGVVALCACFLGLAALVTFAFVTLAVVSGE